MGLSVLGPSSAWPPRSDLGQLALPFQVSVFSFMNNTHLQDFCEKKKGMKSARHLIDVDKIVLSVLLLLRHWFRAVSRQLHREPLEGRGHVCPSSLSPSPQHSSGHRSECLLVNREDPRAQQAEAHCRPFLLDPGTPVAALPTMLCRPVHHPPRPSPPQSLTAEERRLMVSQGNRQAGCLPALHGTSTPTSAPISRAGSTSFLGRSSSFAEAS